jgi:hypothetical protein
MGARNVGQRTGDDQAGETGAGAEVRPSPGLRREGEKLERVRDVTRPHLRDGGRSNEVHPLLPFAEQGHEAGEAVGCFTWNMEGGEGSVARGRPSIALSRLR